MKRLLIMLAAAATVVLAGCAGDDKPLAAGDTGATILASSKQSAEKEQGARDIHDQDAFKKLWDEIYAGRTEPALPTVDFTKNTVVAYFLGEMKHGGFVLRVDRAEAVKDGYDVDFLVISPGNNCHNETQDATQYFLVATVPTTQQVTFDVKNRETPGCR
ncbi:MAG TPA: hypothetical protein VH327_08880 [Gammaproteobacteria bacterium]|jgi:hypothetical protein|nr:hypothetical protein [Gammaproteobacteria bacterium]